MSVAVVTGAARGMGRACVEVAREHADIVVAVDLEAPAIDGTVGILVDGGGLEGFRSAVAG